MIKTRFTLVSVLALGLVATQAGAAENLWTESFDYTIGTLETVSGDWSINTPPSPTVISTGAMGSVSGNNMLDVANLATGNLPRIDRSIGTVVEGKTYRMAGHVYAVDPVSGVDTATIALFSTGGTEIAAWGLDDGAVTYKVPGAPTPNMKPDGFINGSWQRYDLIYRSIAAAPDEMEAFIDGTPAAVGGSPVGILSPTNGLSTTVNNTLRIQGRDLPTLSALHIDDVSWTLLAPVMWTDSFEYDTGAVATVAGNWSLVPGNVDSFVISNGTAGSPSGNNMLDLPDSETQARVDRDIGPVVEGTTYRAIAYLFAENPGPSLDVATISLMSTGEVQIVSWGLDDGVLTYFVPGASPAVYKPSGLVTGVWQKYQLNYESIAGAPDEMEVFIDDVAAKTSGVPIGVVSPTVDLSTTALNRLRMQGRDVLSFSALHIDDVTWVEVVPPPRGSVFLVQ